MGTAERTKNSGIDRRLRDALLASMLAGSALTLAGCGSGQTHAAAPNPTTPVESTTTSPTNTPPSEAPTTTPKPSTTSPNISRIGYDVSYPQQGQTLPNSPSFAIVGVNGTLANNPNIAFSSELAWAKTATGNTTQPKAQLYVHYGNPGDTVSDWATFGGKTDAACLHSNSSACAYKYGNYLAEGDKQMIRPNNIGAFTVWLDVENNYSFQPSTSMNDAVMEGMVQDFESSGARVGIYSNQSEWNQMMGTVPKSSNLYGLPEWVLGATTLSSAEANCASPSFTMGKVVLAQVAGNMIDQDIAC